MSVVRSYHFGDSGEVRDCQEIGEFRGRVKQFKTSGGYGFIVPEGGGEDIFFHAGNLFEAGYTKVLAGSRVVCGVVRGPKGLRVSRIIEMDESTAKEPPRLPPGSRIVEAEGEWENATVKWFNSERGFGFLTRGIGTPDIFCHASVLKRSGFLRVVAPGRRVEVRYGRSPYGLSAVEIRFSAKVG